MEQANNYILEANNISKRYVGVQALDNVSVKIKKGEIKCLAGENGCGKSTFVKTIAGVVTPDSGEIKINGQAVDIEKTSPIDAINMGIQVIYQDLSLFDHMTVAENIAMNKLVHENKRLVSTKDVYDIAQRALDLIGVQINLDAKVQEISIANRQLVAICRALALDAKLLFMDEPTTALTKKEVDRLLSIVLDLKAKGISIVFISHKLDEVLKIADTITVFRDGRLVGECDAGDIDQDKLAYMMTGRSVKYSKYERLNENNDPLIEIDGLSKKGNYKDINISIRRGDIIGLTGLLGSGRTELALSLFGLNKPDSGKIYMEGQEAEINSPWDAMKYGIGLVPEDRSTQGLLLKKSVNDNIASAIIDKLKTSKGFVDVKRQEEIAEESVKHFGIKTHKIHTRVGTLSGGNQQKTVIAKWASTDPKLFILDTPTVGVDIGSKAEIYSHIQNFAKNNMGVIMISDEVDEIVANCNRVIVMYDGRKMMEFDEEDMKSPDIARRISVAIEAGEKTAEVAEEVAGGVQ